MIFPFESLVGSLHQVGLVVGVMIGFGFGFVLERAGFGRSTKLAAQFYLYDMTVFKVMFGAIVTAMLGLVLGNGLGLLDLASLSAGAVSSTFVWPMLIGGFVLGMGFIISGYCPGTSLVATASGNVDGLFTVLGVVLGSLIFGEVYPAIEGFFLSGNQGQLFLYQWLGVPPVVLAGIVTVVAIAAFFGAEKVEKIMTARIAVAREVVDEELRSAPVPRRYAFGFFGGTLAVALVTLFLPVSAPARERPTDHAQVDVTSLAHQILDTPWSLRILDVRDRKDCLAERVPGAECVPVADLDKLGLGFAAGQRTLVVVGDAALGEVPQEALAYPGKVRLLRGGHGAWHDFALSDPTPPDATASAEVRDAFTFRSAVHAVMTGARAAAPPPAAPVEGLVPKKKKKEGGCG
ncbi:MAG: YeeE/YedE thiosulfate transporter family protein [Pseudomonadota bacterium]